MPLSERSANIHIATHGTTRFQAKCVAGPFAELMSQFSEDPNSFDDSKSDSTSDEAGFPGNAPNNATGATDSRDEMEQAMAEQRDKYMRLAAEYDNYRKRTLRERQEAQARGQAELVKQLIDTLDDLGRFAHLDPSTVDAATVVQGADMIEKKLLKTLGAAGLQVINPVNQTFDPTQHEAVSTEPALSPEDDHVVSRVFQLGYLFNGQLLRPARVVVKQWNG